MKAFIIDWFSKASGWQAIFLYGVPPLLVAVTIIRFREHQKVLRTSEGRSKIWNRLEKHRQWSMGYFWHMRHTLTWVDSKLGSRLLSGESYDFALRLAFIFPFISLVISWAVSGQNTGISGMLLKDTEVGHRNLAITALGLSAASFYVFLRNLDALQRDDRWMILAFIGFCSAGIFDFVANGFDPRPGPDYLLVILAFVAGLAGFVVPAIIWTVIFASLYTGIGNTSFGSSLFFGSFAIAIVTVFGQDALKKRGHHDISYIVLAATLFLCLSMAAFYAPEFNFANNIDERIFKFYVIFLLLLPLVNANFDWLALAATRSLLRDESIGKRPFLQITVKTLAGFAIGVILLVVSALACTAALQSMNLLSQSNGGPQFFDLAGLLHRIRTNPSDPAVWWVYAMLFSTLMPTLAYGIITAGSFINWQLPTSWRNAWQKKLAQHDLENRPFQLAGMATCLTALDAVAIVLGVSITVSSLMLLSVVLPLSQLGWMILAACEFVAHTLGAQI